ncbi:MAG: PKD domain-containing protein [Methylococcaceae bacterium]
MLSIAGSQTIALAEDDSFIKQVNNISTKKLGISFPLTLTYSPHRQTLFLGRADQTLESQYEMLAMSLSGDITGSQRIKADIFDPLNISFDSFSNRLLLLNHQRNAADILIALDAGDSDDFDKLEQFDVQQFELQDPQGLTVNTLTGEVYFLDAAGPRIVCVKPKQDGNFNLTKVIDINLPGTGSSQLQSIAFNPEDEHIYVLDTAQLNLIELSLDGQLLSTRNLSKLTIRDPQNMVFAPSADNSDDPSEMSLYIHNRSLNGVDSRISELTLSPPKLAVKDANAPVVTKVSAAMEFKVKTSTFNPSSPDPSGIGYLPNTNTLLISDGEVEEPPTVIDVPVLFEGFNLFETDLEGNLIASTSVATQSALDVLNFSNVETAGFSDEPVGVSEINPINNHIFISDDDADEIFEVDPASDGQYGTTDDIVTSFSTRDFVPLSNDPEGVAYAAQLGDLFIADGINNEVYRVSPGRDGVFHHTNDNTITHFDTEQHGLEDPEGIAYFPTRGNLLVIGNSPEDTLFEFTTSGNLVRKIDLSEAINNDLSNPAGLALAPPDANNPNTTCIFVVDRADDNDSVPGENDGLLFKMCFPTRDESNLAPAVNAGPNQTISLLENVVLNATINDDGLPSSSDFSTHWTKTSGPGTVVFANDRNVDTTATFSVTGTYELQLSATDGDLENNDTLTITVIYTADGSLTTIERRVTASSDDAEQRGVGGSIKLTSSDLEFVFDSDGNQLVGIRFNELEIPQGAFITHAYLQFETDEATPQDTTNLLIEGEAVANAVTFTSSRKNISKRKRTAASILWSPNPWTTVNEAGLDQRSPNISAIIQEIVHLDWSSGNSMVLIISGTGERTAESSDGDKAGAPLLHIEYTTSFTTIEKRVTASSDDAEERESGSIKLTSSDLEFVFDSDGDQTVGMRFNELAIPKGAFITHAYLQFETDETTPQNRTNLLIEGEAVANAETFTSTRNNISDRKRTAASTQWSPNPWTTINEAGEDQRSPNIATIIQEIVYLDWSSGNSIVLIISGKGERTAESFDGDTAGAPLLHVEYILP